MAIIAILASIAYPSYQHHLLQTHRHQAQIQLMEIANQLEDYHDANNTYRDANLDSLGVKLNPYYDFELSDLTDDYYQIKASPKDSQIYDECGTLSIDQLGKQNAANNYCWQ
jgi:type IV pilus assembly protein PilE